MSNTYSFDIIHAAMSPTRLSTLLQQTISRLGGKSPLHGLSLEHRDGDPMPCQQALAEVVDLCRSVFFPGYFGQPAISARMQAYHLGVSLERLHTLLTDQVLAGLCSASPDECGQDCERGSARHNEQVCARRAHAEQIAEEFIQRLPALRDILATDVEAAYNVDPAADSYGEIISCYPVIRALANYRVAHELLVLGVPLIPRIITEMAHSETGIDIHPAATIGHHFTIDHGTGVVIGATCIIGNNVKLYQGVTLGAKSFPLDEHGNPIKGIPRHPILEDNVIVYSNATVLGRITIAKGTIIGGNLWVTESTKPGDRIVQAKRRKNAAKECVVRPEDYGGL